MNHDPHPHRGEALDEPEIPPSIHRAIRRTPDELAKLKHNWLRDPCWDIYATEGFEAHRAELEAFQAEQEKKWQREAEDDRAAEERKALAGQREPVSMVYDPDAQCPLTICRDGSMWRMRWRVYGEETPSQGRNEWERLPAIPGSEADTP